MSSPRYALYFTPPPGSRLARFGAAAMGYDCESATEVALLPLPGIDPIAQALAAVDPARYGFHATLMAPFYLHPGTSESALMARLQTFADRCVPVPLGHLSVGLIGGFVALARVGSQDAIVALAADCVTSFNDCRAPLSADDRKRRIASGLTPAQIELLDRWGYPYVLDEFRFHMTLAGPLSPSQRQPWRAALDEAFGRDGDEQATIDAISLVRQDERGARFRVLLRAPLKG
jgi:hypothetical protein